MSRPATHKHFCAGCALDGVPERQRWWRCIAKPCPLNLESLCGLHRSRNEK